MKFVRIGIVAVFLGILGYGMYGLMARRSGVEAELAALIAEKERIASENAAYEKKIHYYENPENLLKKAKEQSNVREAGESLLIIVPTASSTASTSSSTAR